VKGKKVKVRIFEIFDLRVRLSRYKEKSIIKRVMGN